MYIKWKINKCYKVCMQQNIMQEEWINYYYTQQHYRRNVGHKRSDTKIILCDSINIMLTNARYPWEKIWLETREEDGGTLLGAYNILSWSECCLHGCVHFVNIHWAAYLYTTYHKSTTAKYWKTIGNESDESVI